MYEISSRDIHSQTAATDTSCFFYPRRARLSWTHTSAVAPSKKSFMTTTRSCSPQTRSALSLTHGSVLESQMALVASRQLVEALADSTLYVTTPGMLVGVAWHWILMKARRLSLSGVWALANPATMLSPLSVALPRSV